MFCFAERLLCKWHVNTNIIKTCKKHFKDQQEWDPLMKDWTDLIHVETESDFNSKLSLFKDKWSSNPPTLSYIESSWLPFKEFFVVAWTKRVMHFGCTTTQRVESAHGSLKKLLGASNLNLSLVWKQMDIMIKSQVLDIESAFEMSTLKPTHTFIAEKLFKDIRGSVSSHAMKLIHEEKKNRVDYVGMDHSICGCLLRSTHGLPCAHEIVGYMHSNMPIPLSCIDNFWKQLSTTPYEEPTEHISKEHETRALDSMWDKGSVTQKLMIKQKLKEIINPSSTSVGEPLIKETGKGRPSLQKSKTAKRRKVDTSTKRDLSGFEYAKFRSDEIGSS